MNEDEIKITMGKEDWQEVVINKQLQLHITTNVDGICIDYYKYRTPDEVFDNYDDDYIGTRYFLWEDLEKWYESKRIN